jgi:AmmeMemoRadiSam system protein B
MNTRPSQIAGTWYPGDSEDLRELVSEYISQANSPGLEGEPIALISPHAGYRYSGKTAGHAFKQVQGRSYDLVVVLSPFHSYHPDNILISSYDAYSTPLGDIPIDKKTVSKLNEFLHDSNGKPATLITHENEHSLEIILPFLQVALSDKFKLLPIMLSGHNIEAAESLGKFLANLTLNKKVLLVASTDLSHFHDLQKANILDNNLLEKLISMDIKNIISAISSNQGEACGIMAVLSVLFAAKQLKVNKLQVLNYSTSAEVTGDESSVVGYASAVIY